MNEPITLTLDRDHATVALAVLERMRLSGWSPEAQAAIGMLVWNLKVAFGDLPAPQRASVGGAESEDEE
jgi:hypothetical protein